MLFLWLSIVCMIPFDMSRLDAKTTEEATQEKRPIMDRIIDIGKVCSIFLRASAYDYA